MLALEAVGQQCPIRAHVIIERSWNIIRLCEPMFGIENGKDSTYCFDFLLTLFPLLLSLPSIFRFLSLSWTRSQIGQLSSNPLFWSVDEPTQTNSEHTPVTGFAN